MAKERCPCCSGLPYADCCAPLHRGRREAETPEALMRSRYAAFATKNVDYLYETLHPDHEDRVPPREDVIRALRTACREHRYTGLSIREATPPDPGGVATVTFFAKVFRQGKDLSFAERSRFAKAEGGWRYLSGEALDGGGVAPSHRSP